MNLLILVIALYGITRECDAKIVDAEKTLIQKLLSNYDKRSRPSDTVQVKFSLYLNQIITIIEREQILVINAFLDHEWLDERLKWEPRENNNISLLRINNELLWTPDTFIDTIADNSGFLNPQKGTLFLVQNTGIIFWSNPMSQLKVRCRMHIAWFPYDEQLCTIIFGSWSYTSNCLNYTIMHENPSLKNFTDNQEWHLITYKPTRFEIKYDHWFDNNSFSEIKYQILMVRKSLFVLQNYVIPAIYLCTLTLVSFYIPFPQAMQIGISILLSFAVFKLRLSDDVPVQSDSIPLINIYFTLCITFSLSSMIWFSIVNYIKEMKVLPRCLRYVIVTYICFIMRAKANDETTNINTKPIPIKTEDIIEIEINGTSKKLVNELINNAEDSKLSNEKEKAKNKSKSKSKTQLTDAMLMLVLNKFMFYLFLIFIIMLNLLLLFIFPYFVKENHQID